MRHVGSVFLAPLSIGLVLAAAWAAAPGVAAAPPDPAGGVGGGPLAGTLTVRVVAAGSTTPLAGAMVLVGRAEGDPFPGNLLSTDASGQAIFAHPSLDRPVTVTAGAAGRAYATLFDLPVSDAVLSLPVVEPLPTARLGDQFLGIEVANGFACFGDGNLDFGIVAAAVPVEDALGGGAGLTLSAAAEPLSTPQGPVPVPGNLYFPRQCELLQYFEKPSYHLRVSTGRRTLFGLSVRAPLSTFLNAATTVDLVQALSFRELDLLRNLDVQGDGDAAALDADLPLAANMTLQVANGRPGTAVYAASGGTIVTPDGQQELILTGAGAFDPDLDGASATLSLTTRPATGDLSDLVHAAVVTQQRDVETIGNGRGATTALARSGMTPPVTRAFSSFYEIVEVASADDETFSWTDVTSPSSPPARHWNTARLVLRQEGTSPDDPSQTAIDSRTVWILHAPGASDSVTLPRLPTSAPTAIPDPDATPANDRLDWALAVQYLGDDPDGFSYESFAFRDVARYGTHLSTNERPLRCRTRTEIGGLLLAKGATPGQVTLSWGPSGDLCHDTLSGVGYEVFAAATPRPSIRPGSWPNDPTFARITAADLDGSSRDAGFTYAPPDGLVCFLVADRGLDGVEGPVGHYGSTVTFVAP